MAEMDESSMMYVVAYWYRNKEFMSSPVPRHECVGLQCGDTVLLRRNLTNRLELANVFGFGDTNLAAKMSASEYGLRSGRLKSRDLYSGKLECMLNIDT